jgi:beta-lactam-binding protein with PASTA domain
MQPLFERFRNNLRLFNNYIITNSRLIIRNVIILIVLCVVVLVSVSLLVFLLIRTGAPEVSVPKVIDKELIEGLLTLQKKKLDVTIDPRYFSQYEKNVIVEQTPKPGSIVREGKVVRLVVSKGPIISIVEDYTGKTVPFVQNRLQEIFSFQGKTIRIGAVTTVASEEPAGTIVGQSPAPDTPITNVEKIDLVVSKGKELTAFTLKDYRGEQVDKVMEILSLRGVLVEIVPEVVNDPSKSGIITLQDPEEGTLVRRNEVVTFHVGYLPSEQGEDKLYARVLNFDVPADLESSKVRIVVQDKIGEREIYNEENEGGDTLSVPFKSYSNTKVYIYVNDALYDLRRIE